MESSGRAEETLIWSNINDARNLSVITKENEHIRDFVPKVAIQKNVEIVNEMIPESTIQDILTMEFDKLNVYEIMTYQVQIISYLSAKFRSTDATEITWEFYRPYLEWILATSEFITEKFGILVDEVKHTGTVTRSSYKFCDLKEGCKDTYGNPLGSSRGDGRPRRCMGDHYVHNKIVRDLRSSIGVINSESSEQAPMSHYLRLGLTTTDFVIRHMYQELGIFNTYLKDTKGFNIENYYICQRSRSTGNGTRQNTFGNKGGQHGGKDYDRNKDYDSNRGHSQHSRPPRNEFPKTNHTNAFSALDGESSEEDTKLQEIKTNRIKEPKVKKTVTKQQASNAFEFLCEMSDSDEDSDSGKKEIVQINVVAKTDEHQHTPSQSTQNKDKKKSGKNKKKKGKK